ncbi:MAG: acetylserotonin O-methyltransferase [Pyrinomonadaceae bacterium]|nr:acetylserotonin O-methyltransferase [Pyrinomonadaceae bacterium]
MTTQSSAAAEAAIPVPPEAQLMQIVAGCFPSQAVYVAAKLGIADLLKSEPLTVAELARETGTHERALYRVLRCLASLGVFRETETGEFELTPTAELLASDHPGSMRDAAVFMGEPWHWSVYSDMLYSVTTGKVAWERVHGKEVFPYFQEHPEEYEVFNRAMTSFSTNTLPAIVEAYEFTGVKKLADIAGGHGMLLGGFLKANPDLKGLLFDLPQVIEGAPALLEKEGVADRVELKTGDFFESVPAGADAYMMKFIIHDWDDERALKILRNIHRVLPADGRLLLVEMVVPMGNEPHFSKIQDLEMLVSPGGAERTPDEYRDLLAKAGFALRRIIPTKSPLSIVEAFKN